MSVKKIITTKLKFVLLFFLIATLFALGILLKKDIKPTQTSRDIPYEDYADEILDICSKEASSQTCYDEKIPKLMDRPTHLSMEDAFMVTKLVQEKDASFPYCHVLGHHLSAKEVKRNPSKWKDVVSRCPSGVCSNGCIHGGFQERFRADSLSDSQIEEVQPDLENICEKRPNWHPTGLEQASCYHALGHLTMYITNANLARSIKLCEEIAVKNDGRDFSRVCLDGVFMQIFQPLEPEDFALVKSKQPAKEQVASFCKQFTGKTKSSCMSESWPLFRKELEDPQGLVKFCSAQDAIEQKRCYTALMYVMTAQFNFDLEKMYAYCSGLPRESRAQCFADVASRLIETDYKNIGKSVALCRRAQPFDEESLCFRELLNFASYNYHTASEEFYRMCSSLPEPWKEACVSKSTSGAKR